MKLNKVDEKTAYENLLVKYAELVKENAELEAQIEKMKCCGNCARFYECRNCGDVECKNFDKWEIKEND